MPNPYAVEYRTILVGLVVIQTRRGSDVWHVRLNNLSPTFRSKRHEDLYNINGIAGLGAQLRAGRAARQEPRVPGADGAVPLQQRRRAEPSEDERRTTHWISSFTRVDANLTSKHALVASAGLFPSVSNMASLGTFTPPDATVDIHERVMLGTMTERALWSDSLVSESTVQVRSYNDLGPTAGDGADATPARNDAGQLLQYAVPNLRPRFN